MGTNKNIVLICSVLCVSVAASLNEQDPTINVFPPLPFAPTDVKNGQCSGDSKAYVENLRNFTFWAHQMWDSTSKSTEGVFAGRLHHLGNFDECLTATAPFDTHFCLVTIKLDSHILSRSTASDPFEESVFQRLEIYEKDKGKFSRLTFKSGWCIPASCSDSDAKMYLNNYYEKNAPAMMMPYKSAVTEVICQKNVLVRSIEVTDVCFILLIAVLLVCITLGTMQETAAAPNNNIKKLLLVFSLKKNWAELKKGDEKDALSFQHAIRVFSSITIVIVHRILFFAKDAPSEYIAMEKLLGLVWLMSSAELLVDSLYVLSGLLATHNILKKKKLSFSIAFYTIASRYMRLTPTYGLVIFFYASVMDLMGSGPLWKSIISHESGCCRESWLLNLLYINNYVNLKRMCIVQSWSLPCDFHFFLICVMICAVIKRNQKLGLGFLVGTTVLSVIMSFAILYVNREQPIVEYWPKSAKDWRLHPEVLNVYMKSHLRAPPYLLGALVGYIYHHLGTTRRELLTKVQSRALVLVSIGFIILPMVARVLLYDFNYKYDAFETATYGALNRTVWAAGTCGLLLYLSYGCIPEWLSGVLLWKPLFVLSKLSYSIYLVHLQFILRDSASSRSTRVFTLPEMFSSGIADVVKSYIWGLILYLAVEAPFRQLFKVLFKNPMSKISEDIKSK